MAVPPVSPVPPVGPRPDVLVVGEALVDVVHRGDGSVDEKPGGSPANVAITLGRLGRSPRLLSSLGDDRRGREVRAWLEASGVVVQGRRAERTSTATAHLDADGAARYNFSIEWALALEDVEGAAGAAGAEVADALHVGSIATILEPGATTVSSVVDQHRDRALITYDPNIRVSLIDDADAARRRVTSFIERADVVKASDEDLAWLCPGEDVETVARRWATTGPALVVVTLGSAGAIAVTARARIEVDPESVDVVDTVGAGDTFMGALIDGLLAEGTFGVEARRTIEALDGEQLTFLLRRCARAAAITVSRPGADPPTGDELEAAQAGGGWGRTAASLRGALRRRA